MGRGAGLVPALLVASALMACGGGGTATGTTTGSSTGSTTSSGTGGSGTGGSGAGGSGTGGSGACPAETLCLDVKLQTGASVPGRLGVVWFQLSDDGPAPAPLVAYDAPFDPTVGHLEIPLAAIAIPDEENLLCQRGCADVTMCPCLGEPKLGVGLVTVSGDVNANGKLDVDELFDAAGYGVAVMGMGYSAVEQAALPAPFDGIFPEGVGKGVLPYRILPKSNQGIFDALGRSQPGEVFLLSVCPSPGPQCMLPIPNLT
jgi:hypothetical protein